MADLLSTLTAACSFEEEIKKSRFIAHAAPVATGAQALAFFASVGDSGATHNCWAYKTAEGYRFNDDGEPGGTAGRPILQAIEGKGLTDVAVLVIRYFGGTKLGTGGLVRAYGGCAAKCLDAAPKSVIIPSQTAYCTCNYSDIDRVRVRLTQAGAVITDESFDAEGVMWTLTIPVTELALVEQVYTDQTKGKGQWTV
ncbi:thymidylate synthase [Advenella sp. S44]|uniref:IMPACT family protein n=1 Tax=Advenella sp. S44 TaxID=1982755 RepID=UPI000C295C5F|nr:YigZ family protein [Advenella sp. S44]PJX23762.1 thymidylate synthase [Advenella sp. S44]